jgi:hypothetical protein
MPLLKAEYSFPGGRALMRLCGMNIFAANHVNVAERGDPRIAFVREVVATHPCVAHIGCLALADLVGSPAEALGEPGQTWQHSPVSLHGGEFYTGDDGATVFDPSILFDRVCDELSLIEYLMRCDALALYVGILSESSFREELLVDGPFIGHDEWISRRLTSCKALVTTASDDWEFEICANDAADFGHFSGPIAEAARVVERTPWYESNRRNLTWEEDLDGCLKLKTDQK